MKSHNKARKALAVSLALALLVCLFPTAALAAGETIRIGSTAELIQAIQNQEDGQTWVLAEGTYDVGDACTGIQANLNGVQQGFVLPLYADNLTIRGEGDVTLTSTFDPNTGAWSYQNFITVGGVGVTLENLKLQGNHNSYFDGCNKVLELVGGGKDLTLKNVQCLPLAGDGGQNSGSIYINVADAGSTKLEDVTLYSWINARAVTTGTVLARNVVQDFTDNVYAGYSDSTYGYAWNPGISGSNVQLDGFTIKVDGQAEFIQQVMKNIRPGTTIELMSDIAVSEEVYINGADGVTINGNGHTITAADDFHMNLEGQIQLFKIEADGVALNDVNLVATPANKHTLDIYGAQDVLLNNVTLNHENASGGAPLVVNGSEVTISGGFTVVTGDNSWYGVNVDSKNGPAALAFAEDATLSFSDNSGSGDKVLIFPQNSGTEYDDPVITNQSAHITLDVDENGILNLHTHNPVAVAAQSATCTEQGNTAYWYCEGCGKYFADQALTQEIALADTLIPATGHAQTEVKGVKPATCTETGYTGDLVCSICGEVLEQGEAVAKLGHDYADGICTRCGAADPAAQPVETVPSADPSPAPTAPGEEGEPSVMPQTGDEHSMALWLSLTLLAALALVGTGLYLRKQRAL